MLPNAKKLRSGLVLGLALVMLAVGAASANPGGSGQSGGGFIQSQRSDFSTFLTVKRAPHKFAWVFSGNSLPVFQAPY